MAAIVEKVKQALGSGHKEFSPTPKADRCDACINEARRFAVHVKNMIAELNNWKNSTSNLFYVYNSMLTAPVPRVQDTTPGINSPAITEQALGTATGVDSTILASAGQEMTRRIDSGVIGPLELWLAVYRDIKARSVRLDELRLDLDKHRRSLQTAEEKDRASHNPEKHTHLQKAQVEADTVSKLTQQYNSAEAELYHLLATLVLENGTLTKLVQTQLLMSQEGFAQSLTAFGTIQPGSLPAPGQASRGMGLGTGHEALTTLVGHAPISPGNNPRGVGVHPALVLQTGVTPQPAGVDQATMNLSPSALHPYANQSSNSSLNSQGAGSPYAGAGYTGSPSSGQDNYGTSGLSPRMANASLGGQGVANYGTGLSRNASPGRASDAYTTTVASGQGNDNYGAEQSAGQGNEYGTGLSSGQDSYDQGNDNYKTASAGAGQGIGSEIRGVISGHHAQSPVWEGLAPGGAQNQASGKHAGWPGSEAASGLSPAEARDYPTGAAN